MMIILRMGVAGKKVMALFVISVFANTSIAQINPTKLTDISGGISADPGIVINLKDPTNIVVSVSPDRIFYSVDGGVTWKETIVTSRYGVRGGIKLISENKGGLDLIHYCDALDPSRTNDRFVLQSSGDKGATWKEEAVFGNSVSKDEKETKDQTNLSLSIHPRKRVLYGVWTQSDQLGLDNPNCHSNILFGSWNGGKQWARPVQLNQNPGDCSGLEASAGGASVVMDLNERLYAVWSTQGMIFFDRSYDGEVWLSRDLAIAHPESMTLNVPGFGPITSRPSLIVDETQTTKFHGSLYLVYGEGKKGSLDTNVAMLRSTNHGDNWVGPTRFRKDEIMGQQFAPSIAIDNTTGHVFIACFDRRDYEDSKTEVVLFYSKDGGNNFNQAQISRTPFVPGPGNKVNPVTSIKAHAGTIALTWTRIDDDKASVWTAIIKEGDLK